jgi:hypothetical protein
LRRKGKGVKSEEVRGLKSEVRGRRDRRKEGERERGKDAGTRGRGERSEV